MCSMWYAAEIGMSDLDYYGQFSSEPESPQEIEIAEPEIPEDLEAQWEAADDAQGHTERKPVASETEVGAPARQLWEVA